MSRSRDVVALIFGVVMTSIAVGSMWLSFVGSINWQLVKIVAPLGLIAAGVLGLALSRNRS